MILHTPSKPEQAQGNEDGANIRKRETELGECVAVVPGCELVVHSVNSRYDKENCDKESCTKAEVHEADASRGIAVAVAAPDVFEVGVETVVCAEEDSLI